MSSTEIRLVFGGREVESGKIDASVLGNALTGYNELFRRANELANGEASQAVVFVESDFKTGSFDVTVQLVQTLIENAKSLITAHPFLSAAELAAAIGLVVWHKRESLIGVLKWLRGHKPDKVTQVGNNFDLVLFGQKKTVSNTINVFLNDPQLRQALGRAVQPLREPGIDTIKMQPKTPEPAAEPTTIEKDEAKYLEPDPLELAEGEAPDEGNRDATLIVSKLSFVEGPKWTFFERGATVSAAIEDKEFWEDVHRRKYKFAEGDRLRVNLHWKMVEKGGRLRPENTVIKVYEVVQRVKQIRLDGARDDEIV
ncbi:MAG: hypothetical protein LAO06_06470 [Acidobacteriia bacterium]|nr:hypothetical protein [Terriglobia bacterium]